MISFYLQRQEVPIDIDQFKQKGTSLTLSTYDIKT